MSTRSDICSRCIFGICQKIKSRNVVKVCKNACYSVSFRKVTKISFSLFIFFAYYLISTAFLKLIFTSSFICSLPYENLTTTDGEIANYSTPFLR